jgi:hypothetical protein
MLVIFYIFVNIICKKKKEFLKNCDKKNVWKRKLVGKKFVLKKKKAHSDGSNRRKQL